METTDKQLLEWTAKRGKLSYFVFLFVPILLVIALIGWFTFQHDVEHEIDSIASLEMSQAKIARNLIEYRFESISKDILVLAGNEATVTSLLKNQASTRNILSHEYVVFCKNNMDPIHACLYSSSGEQVLSVDKLGNRFSIDSSSSKQFDTTNDIFKKTSKLQAGNILFSLIRPTYDSNAINNSISPQILASTPIESPEGKHIGLVTISYPLSTLTKHLSEALIQCMTNVVIVTKDGTLLFDNNSAVVHTNKEERQQLKHFQDIPPDEWNKITRSGEGLYRTEYGLFTLVVIGHPESQNNTTLVKTKKPQETYGPYQSSSYPEWILISQVSNKHLSLISTRNALSILFIGGSSALILGVLCWLFISSRFEQKKKQHKIRTIADHLTTLTGESFFRSLVEGLSNIMEIEFALVGEITGKDSTRVRTLALYADGQLSANFEYELANTPCELVLNGDLCVYPSGIQQLFPKDEDLVAMEAESYIGTPLKNSSGTSIGILAVISKQPKRTFGVAKYFFKLFAVRAAAELERLQGEKTLQEKERIIDESQKAALICSYKLDIASGCWECSDNLYNIFGIDCEYERSVNSWLEVVHEDHREEMKEYFLRFVLAERNSFDKRYRIVRVSDNAVRWVHGMGILEFNEDGNPVEMIGTIQDITDRKEAEDALRKSEHRYEELFSSLLEGVCIVDEKEMITFCNRAFSLTLEEESANKVTGKTVFDYVPPENQETILQQTALRKNNRSSQYEIEIMTAKGNRRNLFVSVSPRTNESGLYCGAFANIMDITEEKRLRELESRAQRLETAGQVAGQVAHDFNNLLAPLMAYPELIRDELPDDHPAKKYLNAMERSATQIAEINEQLLTLGRRGHYNHVPIDLNQLVRQAIDQNKQVRPHIEYHTKLATDLSQFTGGPAQIHRVILNLLENACDAMMDTGIISITTEDYSVVEQGSSVGESIPEGDYVKLTLSDTGQGIDSTLLPKIFDPFFSSKESDRNRGSGLGLSIVHSVVKDHGGHIDFSTQPGKGTSFYLYFPVSLEQVEVQDEHKFTGGNESILVVDDDPLQREVALKLLDNLGYDITLVESGEKAIELLSKSRYDLMILDMIMPPGMDGTETFRKALEICPEQKAIIVSGFSESDRVAEAKNLGVSTFVKKPLKRNIIAKAVRTELDRQIRSVTA